MQKKILILAIFALIISSCSSNTNSQQAINKGINYLVSAQDKEFGYKDKYLTYVYPGEDLECPLENCKITYRKIDAFFNLIFICF
mgnify:FL=1